MSEYSMSYQERKAAAVSGVMPTLPDVQQRYDAAGEHLNRLVKQYDQLVEAWEAANAAGYDRRADTLDAQIEVLCRDIEAAGNDVAMWSERLDGVTP